MEGSTRETDFVALGKSGYEAVRAGSRPFPTPAWRTST